MVLKAGGREVLVVRGRKPRDFVLCSYRETEHLPDELSEPAKEISPVVSKPRGKTQA